MMLNCNEGSVEVPGALDSVSFQTKRSDPTRLADVVPHEVQCNPGCCSPTMFPRERESMRGRIHTRRDRVRERLITKSSLCPYAPSSLCTACQRSFSLLRSLQESLCPRSHWTLAVWAAGPPGATSNKHNNVTDHSCTAATAQAVVAVPIDSHFKFGAPTPQEGEVQHQSCLGLSQLGQSELQQHSCRDVIAASNTTVPTTQPSTIIQAHPWSLFVVRFQPDRVKVCTQGHSP